MNAGARCACASNRTPAFPPHSFLATNQVTPLEIATTTMGYVTTGDFSKPLLSGGTSNKNTLTGVTMVLSGTSFGVSVVADVGTLLGESPGGAAGELEDRAHGMLWPRPSLDYVTHTTLAASRSCARSHQPRHRRHHQHEPRRAVDRRRHDHSV